MIYVVSYSTESGDRGVIGYFRKRPSEGHLCAFFKNIMPEEFTTRPTRRLVHWDVVELEEMPLPRPIRPIPSC